MQGGLNLGLEKSKEKERKKLRGLREEISRDEVSRKSQLIWDKVSDLSEFEKSDVVSFYVDKEESKEVETKFMIEKSLSKDKRVVVPYVDGDDLFLSEISDVEEDLERGTYDVLEPKNKSPFSLDRVDVIFVPGLGFDLKGNRLGYGGGYYDRLLGALESFVSKVGLAFDFQVIERVPHNEQDVSVDKIVTEKRIIIPDDEL